MDKKCEGTTRATSNLSIWLTAKISLYLNDLTNPYNGLIYSKPFEVGEI